MGKPESLKMYLTGLIKKGRLVNSSRKRKQACCMPHRIGKKQAPVPESKWTFRSLPQMRDFDYHSEVNADSFNDWFVNRFLNYLEEGSIIIHTHTGSSSIVLSNMCYVLFLYA
jgi:hypothetical protein